jgi:hypothetical protein
VTGGAVGGGWWVGESLAAVAEASGGEDVILLGEEGRRHLGRRSAGCSGRRVGARG